MTRLSNQMRIRHLVSPDSSRKVNVGEWDWEQYHAHQCGASTLTPTEVMQILKRPDRVEALQEEARVDGQTNARRMCVVIENFFSEAECDKLVLQVKPLLNSTKSQTLRNLVSPSDEDTIKLLSTIAEALDQRLRQLGTSVEDEEGQALMRELRVAPEWSCRDYHMRNAERGGEDMEVRFSAMSDNVRGMLYSAQSSPATGDEQNEGDFATDPRNAHHDGRNRRPAGDSFLTALLYLNSEGKSLEGEGGEPLEGGHTLFLDDDGKPVAHAAPTKGSLLIFDHHLYLRGSAVRRGSKFCLRSDLLYMPCDAQTGEPRRDLME